MQFNDATNNQGLVQDTDFWANSDPTIYLIADKTRNMNRYYEMCVSDILSANNRWEWDDTNQTDLPRGVTDLFSGQQQYNFDSTWLTVERVDIKDSTGNWSELWPMNEADIHQGYASFESTNGVPNSFDVDGDNIFLHPTPNYALTGGLKVFFKRKPVLFTVSDTTKEPGFASLYHRILSIGAAYDWCVTKGLPKASSLLLQMETMRTALKAHYASRNRYEHQRIIPAKNSNYQSGRNYE